MGSAPKPFLFTVMPVRPKVTMSIYGNLLFRKILSGFIIKRRSFRCKMQKPPTEKFR